MICKKTLHSFLLASCCLLGGLHCSADTGDSGSSGESSADAESEADSNTNNDNHQDDPAWCLPAEAEVQRYFTGAGIEYVRTPDAVFDNLPGYPFPPHYVEIDGLRMHYVDEGPRDGEVVLMLHGEPSWSYLYRDMISALSAAGHRVIAVDHIGMGRSDKPTDIAVHTYEQHVSWIWRFVQALELVDVTLVAQDWGGLIGLRVAGDHPERFARIVAANTNLPLIPPGANPFTVPQGIDVDCQLGAWQPSEFQEWLEYALLAPDLRPSEVIEALTLKQLSPAVAAAYDAPSPSRVYKAAIRAFPSMIAAVEDQNAGAWAQLGQYDKPFLSLAGVHDRQLGSQEVQQKFIDHIPGSRHGYHERLEAHHFIQEDIGPLLAATINYFMRDNPIGFAGCWQPESSADTLDCEALCDNITSCSPQHPRGICVQSCELVAPYLTQEAANAVAPCIASPSCETHDTWGTALDGCMVPLIMSGQITAPAGNAEHCAQLSTAVETCDSEAQFAQVCNGLAFVFTPDAMAKMSSCSDASCESMGDCILGANCSFLFDDRGALPQ